MPWRRTVRAWNDTFAAWPVALMIFVALAASQPGVFLTGENIGNVLRQSSFLALLAAGQFLAIAAGGIDLSVGSVMALAMYAFVTAVHSGAHPVVAICAGIVAGVVCGAVNGVGITALKLPHPFVMTLATLYLFRGVANLASGGTPRSGLIPGARWLGTANVPLGTGAGAEMLPVSAIVVILMYMALSLVCARTVRGRHLYAMGYSKDVAARVGIATRPLILWVYSVSGGCAGIAACILAGRTNSAFPSAGIGAELDSIAAVIIGRGSFFGGRGTPLGTLSGVAVMALFRNGLSLFDVHVFWQQVVIGVLVIAAVAVDGSLARRESKGKLDNLKGRFV